MGPLHAKMRMIYFIDCCFTTEINKINHLQNITRACTARWCDGEVVRWRGGARWYGGEVMRWRGDAVVRWRGDAVAR